MFIRMLRHPVNSKSVANIVTYKDFIRSNCSLAILLYDVGWCEVFAKKQEEMVAISQALHSLPHGEFENYYDINEIGEGFVL